MRAHESPAEYAGDSVCQWDIRAAVKRVGLLRLSSKNAPDARPPGT